jgi:hypothetical protein
LKKVQRQPVEIRRKLLEEVAGLSINQQYVLPAVCRSSFLGDFSEEI